MLHEECVAYMLPSSKHRHVIVMAVPSPVCTQDCTGCGCRIQQLGCACNLPVLKLTAVQEEIRKLWSGLLAGELS